MNSDNASQGGGSPDPQAPQVPQAAAANVIRSQINAIYGDRPVAPVAPRETAPQAGAPTEAQRPMPQAARAPQATPAPQVEAAVTATDTFAQSDNLYNRTHTQTPQPQADQWKAYHSAWQDYYQRYYEAFYAHKQASEQPAQTQAGTDYFTADTSTTNAAPLAASIAAPNETVSKDQALLDLRQKLLGTVKHRAKTIRGSKHFMPIAAALSIVLLFAFLQYNQVLFAAVNAYVSPGAIDPQNIVIDPSDNTAVSTDPRLIIPKINVDVPVIYGVGNDHNSQMDAMEKGVAHFAIPGASSHPGEAGNTVLSGHSSNDLFDSGDYKFIFAQLDKLTTGDTIYANYEGTRYTYVVTKKEVVKPTQVNKLVYDTDTPVMTLITCTPLGTSLNRLLVTAKQVSPDPTTASAAPKDDTSNGEDAAIPGSSPTLLERLFGAE